MMQVSYDNSGSHATLRLNGSFDMESNAPFRSAYRQALSDSALRSLTLEFSGVEYMDSSALGMLLLLKAEVEKQGATVILAGCKPFVLGVLTTANFHRMFKIA